MAVAEQTTVMRGRPAGRAIQVVRLLVLGMAGYAAMVGAIVLIGLPLAWMLSAAFKQTKEIYIIPTTWIPAEPTLSNFPAAWQSAPFGRYFLNSILVTTVGSS